MFWLNTVVIGGVIANAPSVLKTNGVTVMSLSLRAIKPLLTRKEGQANYFTVKLYQEIAEYALRHFHRGDAVVIDGELSQQTSRDFDGKVQYHTVVVAHRIFPATMGTLEASELSPGIGEARREANGAHPNAELRNAQAAQMAARVRRESATRLAREVDGLGGMTQGSVSISH